MEILQLIVEKEKAPTITEIVRAFEGSGVSIYGD
jgi:hypothetical protein